MVRKWETIEDKYLENLKIFDLHRILRKHPEWYKQSNFIVLDSPQWVNIIPITTDKKVVLIEQYRHGIDEITLEVPGGLVEKKENPREAGERECTEETGYIGKENAILIGENYPNPAFLNNKCYSFVWFDCEKRVKQSLDGSEDINVILVPINEIKNMILKEEIRHSLVLTAFFFYFLKYDL